MLRWVHRYVFDAWTKTPAWWLAADYVAMRSNTSGIYLLQKHPAGVPRYHHTREALEAAVSAHVEACGGALTIISEDENP